MNRHLRIGAAVLTAVVLAAAVLDIGGLRSRLLGGAAGPAFRSLAVLPVANLSGDPAQEYFTDGMTDALIADLSKISSLRITNRMSVMQYKNAKKPLLDYIERGGTLVIQYNVASGVLALVAAKVGATHVVAVDISPRAVENTRLNCRLLEFQDVVAVPDAGDLFEPVGDERFDLVVFNPPWMQGRAVTLYDTEGDIVASLSEYWIPPAKFVQYNIFQALGIDLEMHTSIEVHVVSGGPVAGYASEIDNRTQDPILVPAVVPASP